MPSPDQIQVGANAETLEKSRSLVSVIREKTLWFTVTIVFRNILSLKVRIWIAPFSVLKNHELTFHGHGYFEIYAIDLFELSTDERIQRDENEKF